MAAESNGGRNPAFKVTNAASTGKCKKLNNKRSHEAAMQNGSVEGEETLAAAGASADAKESPPEKCRKTRDVQDTSYHGQDAASPTSEDKDVGHMSKRQRKAAKKKEKKAAKQAAKVQKADEGKKLLDFGQDSRLSKVAETPLQDKAMEGYKQSKVTEGTKQDKAQDHQKVADNEDSCPWKYVEDDSSETTVNKNQSHKGGDQQKPSKGSLPTQRHRVSFKLSHSRGRLPANSSQEKLDKSHDTTSSDKSDHSRSHDRSHNATRSRKSNRSRSHERSHNATRSRKSDRSRSHERSHNATRSRKSNRSRSHERSHNATRSRKSDRSRSHERSHNATRSRKSNRSKSRDRSYDGVQDRSHSGNRHNSQGCDNHEKDYRYLENAKKEDRQQKKWQNDQRSASQQEQAHGGKKNKNKKNQKEGIQNILEWLRRNRPPRRGEPIELVEIKGDLFKRRRTDAMAHCVSEDLAMGKGIAVRFKEAFHGVDDLRAQAKKVGDVATLYRQGIYVYYLITKKRYFCKPTYQTLESSLTAMKNHMVWHKVTHLSMPTIGCGLDRLVWDVVAYIIRRVFHGTGIQITVYHYDGK